MSGLVIGQAAGRKGVSSVALTVPSILAVTGSPITDSGTFAISLATQTANQFFAGPSSGGAATPTFRAITTADLPAAALNVGTVTSVALTAPTELSVSGSPVTGSGTLALSWASQTTNKVLAAPNGSTGTPSFRALVEADIPTLTTQFAATVIIAPAASTRNVIQPTGAAVIPLIVRGAASQSANLQEWQNSGGSILFKLGIGTSYSDDVVYFRNSTPAMLFSITGDGRVGVGAKATFDTVFEVNMSGAKTTGVPMIIRDATYNVQFTTTSFLSSSPNFSLGANGNGSAIAMTAPSNYALRIDAAKVKVGDGSSTAATTTLHAKLTDAATITADNVVTIEHASSGTPAAGFGVGLVFIGKSSTTAERSMGRVRTEWTTATDASRASKMVLSIYAVAVETDVLTITSGGLTIPNAASYKALNSAGTSQDLITLDAGNNLIMRQSHASGAVYYGTTGTGAAIFHTNNSERMRIDNAGLVGIGITPTKLLHVSKSDTDTTLSDGVAAVIRVSNPSATLGSFTGIEFGQYSADYTHAFIGAIKTDGTTTGTSDLVFATKASTSDNTLTEYMRIKAGGGVGIGGTPIAGRLLHVISATSPVVRLSGGAASNQYIEFDQNGTIKGVIGFNTSDTMQIAYGPNFNANFLAINSSGSVGIGTNSPARLLAISAAQPYFRLNSSNTALLDNGGPIGDIEFYTNDLSAQGAGIAASIKAITARSGGGMDVASELVFSTRIGGGLGADAAEKMVLDRNGNIGLGITLPTVRLHAVQTDTATITTTNVLIVGHNTSGTAAAVFGTGIALQGQSSTTANTDMGRIRTEWTTATHASRASKMVLSVYNVAAEVDTLTILSNGVVIPNAASYKALDTLGTARDLVTLDAGNNYIVRNSHSSGSAYYGTTGTGAAYIHTNNVERIRVDNAGLVSIGNITPTSKLDVNGDVEIPFANAYYFGDPTTDGSLRLIPSGTNLLLQRRIAGVWTTGTTITG